MMQTFVAIERDFFDTSKLSPSQLNKLFDGRRRTSLLMFDETRADGRWGVRFRGFAGVLSLGDGAQLEVLPKILQSNDIAALRRKTLRFISSVSDGIVLPDASVWLGSDITFVEAYLRWILDETENKIGLGLPRDYVRSRQICVVPKG